MKCTTFKCSACGKKESNWTFKKSLKKICDSCLRKRTNQRAAEYQLKKKLERNQVIITNKGLTND